MTTKTDGENTKPMTLNEYQDAAFRTATYRVGIDKMLADASKDDLELVGHTVALTYAALGLTGEAGEFADQAKRVLRDDDGVLTPERRDKLIKELGDCCWYIAAAATELGISLEEVARINIAKLKARQEQGKLKGEGGDR